MAQGDTIGRDVHPNDDLLLALHDDVLFPGDRPSIEGHLKGCARCQARLTALTDDIATPAPPTPAPPPGVPVQAASVTGVVLRRLVAVVIVGGVLGGVGVVARREFNRRSTEPVALATVPDVPMASPAPAITGIPAPPTPELAAPPDAASSAPSSDTAPSSADALPAPIPDPIVITSPNSRFRWRVVGLEVERTTDGGNAWRKQSVDLIRSVAGGTAPSAAVCWLVGRGGMVFVAVGSEWKNVSLKETADLVRVAATDSMNATVTAMDGRQFSTSDAGATWNVLSR